MHLILIFLSIRRKKNSPIVLAIVLECEEVNFNEIGDTKFLYKIHSVGLLSASQLYSWVLQKGGFGSSKLTTNGESLLSISAW